jgi:metal-responsive CopG/Arc/MetJ family transcriptional regulator
MPVTATKKVTITFPSHILSEVERSAKKKKTAVGKLIRRLVENSLQQERRANLAEQLREGYLVNASRDLAIAEEFKFADAEIDRALHAREEK